jgi:hypothetical protein
MFKNSCLGIGSQNKTINEEFTGYNKILERAEAREPTLKLKTWQRFEITKEKVIDFVKHQYSVSQKLIREIRNTLGDDFKHYLITEDDLGLNTG